MQKRIEKIKLTNEKRTAETKTKIENTIALDNLTNKLARDVMNSYIENGNNDETGKLIMRLAQVIVRNRLVTLSSNRTYDNERFIKNGSKDEKTGLSTGDKQYNNMIVNLEKDIIRAGKVYLDIETKRKIERNIIDKFNNNSCLYYTDNGDIITEVIDTNSDKKLMQELSNIANCDGNDLVSDVVCMIYSYLDKCKKPSVDYLQKPFEIVIPKSTIYKNGDKKPRELWQYTTTNVIQECGKIVSKSIDNSKAKQAVNIPYEKIEFQLENNEMFPLSFNGKIDIYSRFDEITAEELTDINGKIIGVVNNRQIQFTLDNFPKKVGLSVAETRIFNLYFRKGKSILQCCDKLGISDTMVKRYIHNIRDKSVRSGYFAEMIQNGEKIESHDRKAQKIVVMLPNGSKLAEYESLRECSKMLNISAGNISQVLNGKRKLANGLFFKKI